MANLLDQASIVLTPTAYDNGKVLCAKPSEAPYGDFDFSRNSAATRVNAQGLVENVQILSSNLVQNGDFSEEGVQEVSNGSFSQEGVQLVTNGDFATDSDWAKGTGWSISGGSANCDGTQISATNLIQNGLALGTGKILKITFQLKDYQAGELIYVNLTGTGILEFENINANGTYVAYSGLSTGDNFITFRADADFIGSIDNVSVREVGQDWVLGTGWSIGEDKAVATNVNGTFLAQNSILTSGKTYKITYTVQDYLSGSIRFRSNLVNGSTNSGNGTYTDYIVSGGTQFALQGRSSFNGSITNISVKEVGMDWTLGSFTSIGNNVANIVNSTGELSLQQGLGIVQKTIKVTYTISGYVSGVLRVQYGNINGVNRSANGTYTDYITGVAANDNLNFYSLTSDTTASITNISVIEITDDTNLPRINYENFSYQDALGSELVVNGTFDTDSANWLLTGASFWVNSSIEVPTGGLSQAFTLANNKTYKITFDVIQGDGIDGGVYVNTNYNTPDFANNVGASTIGVGGTYTFTFTMNGQGNGITLTRRVNNQDIRIDNVSVKEYLGQEVVPNSGCGSWLFEPQSTNLIPYSEDYNSGNWYEYNETYATIDASQSNPSGANGSYKIESLSGLGRFGLSAITVAPSTNYTLSFYVKNINATLLKVVLGSGASPGSYTYTSDVNTSDWSRVSVNFTTGAVTSMQIQFLRDLPVGESAYIWGAMLEQNSFSTSYIPTSGSQVTRNQDVCTNGGSLASINSTEGVLYAEIAALANDGTNRGISISDGTSNNRITFLLSSNNSMLRVFGVTSAALQFNIQNNTFDTLNYNKIAILYQLNNFKFFVNGTQIGSSTIGAVPIGLNSISFNNGSGGANFFGKTKALAVWKEALSDQELADLTYPTPTDPTFTLDFDTIAEQFTFARGSEATYVDAQGLIQSTNELGEELITNGDFATDTDWSFIGDTIIQNGVAEFPTSTNSFLIQSNVIPLSVKTYKLQYEVITTNGNNFRLAGGNSAFGTVALDSATIGVKTIYIVSNGTKANLQFNNDSFIGSIDNVSVKEYTTATNTPRLDYSTGAEAFLLEPQSTNLIPYSEDFSSLNIRSNALVTSNQIISPSGLLNADEITFDGTGTGRVEASISVTVGQPYTISLYLKNKDLSDVTQVWIGFSASSQGQFVTITDEWQRYDITTNADGATEYPRIQFSGTGSLYAWGFQTEQQSYATSYIPTSGTTVTRNQETCINATPEINSEEGVLYAEISALANDLTDRDISISDGTNNNVVRIRLSRFSNNIGYYVLSNGVTTVGALVSGQTQTNTNKIAVKYKQDDFALWINGVEVATDTSGNTPIGLSSLQFTTGNVALPFFGNTKDLQVYTKALSDAELIKLTT